MPVSKKNKNPKKELVEKKPKKKKATKKKLDTQKAVKKDIKEAVNQLPGLIIEQVKFENQMQKKAEELNEVNVPVKKFSRPQNNKDEKTKRLLMWLFVFIITAVIFSMWFWNVTVLFRDAGRNQSTEGLFGNVKTNYDQIMNSDLMAVDKTPTNDEVEKEKIKNSIKASLSSLFATIPTSTNNITTTTSSSKTDTNIEKTTTTIQSI